MKEIHLLKQNNGSFAPVHDSDKVIVDKLKKGGVYRFKISKPRNVLFHRKFFALLNIAFEHQDQYKDFDHFRHDLTIECGYFEDSVNYFTGEVKRKPKSISFAKMGEFEFQEFYKSFIVKICEIYGYDFDVFAEEIENITR